MQGGKEGSLPKSTSTHHTPLARSPKPRLACRLSARCGGESCARGIPRLPMKAPHAPGSFETPRGASEGAGVAKSSATLSQYLELQRPPLPAVSFSLRCGRKPAVSEPRSKLRLQCHEVPAWERRRVFPLPARSPFPLAPGRRGLRGAAPTPEQPCAPWGEPTCAALPEPPGALPPLRPPARTPLAPPISAPTHPHPPHWRETLPGRCRLLLGERNSKQAPSNSGASPSAGLLLMSMH